MIGRNNELLVPALIGLGLFANSTDMCLANNTSILLILFLLLNDKGGHRDDGHFGDGFVGFQGGSGRRAAGRAFGRALGREVDWIDDGLVIGCVPPCCDPCAHVAKKRLGRFDGCNPCAPQGFLDGFGCGCDCDEHHHHHHHHRRKRRRRREKEEFSEHVADEVVEHLKPINESINRHLERIERCACKEPHHHF